jgi:Flp pilus assembly protein TadD
MIRNGPLLSVAAIALLLACLWSPAGAATNPGREQVCDATADYFLRAENYSEAIRLHREVLRKYPESALAHYHLGFAEGMVGDRTQELNEYRRAAELGLLSWDLFLNTGLALFENGSLEAATDALRRLEPDQLDARNMLGVIYARQGHKAQASVQWRDLLCDAPDYGPARANLSILDGKQPVPAGKKEARCYLQRPVDSHEGR